jgi:endonuclease YncB( thermonuclease family)
VIFRVEYQLDNGKRVGEVWLGTEDIRDSVVSNGWAAVPPRKAPQQGNPRPVSKEEQALLTRMNSFERL